MLDAMKPASHARVADMVVIMNRPVRDFKIRFDRPVRFQPPSAMFRILPNSEAEILNRKKYEQR